MSSESRGVGGGGLLQMSSDWDDRVGIKIKTQKNLSGFEQNPQKSVDQKLTPPPKKIPWGIFEPEYAGTTTNLQIVVNPKQSLLKSSHPKNTSQIFLSKKNPGIENLKPQKIPRSSPSLKILSTALGIE